MKVKITPSQLAGSITIPPSKSHWHRVLICDFLAGNPVPEIPQGAQEDIIATANILRAMQAAQHGEHVELFANESASTLRFLLPVAAALGINATFTGAGRLPKRPLSDLLKVMSEHGISVSETHGASLPVSISGTLKPGAYEISGSVSSQYVSGLLMALPLLNANSTIRLTTKLQSAPYVYMTLDVLELFGIEIAEVPGGFDIPGNQSFKSPEGGVEIEGDWSGAAFWLAANAMGSNIKVNGLTHGSMQGDEAVQRLLDEITSKQQLIALDLTDTPDLLPALAIAAAYSMEPVTFNGLGRLRLKESDRVSAVARLCDAIGSQGAEQRTGLTVIGKKGAPFDPCEIDGCGDHRIVMAGIIAASFAAKPCIVTDVEFIAKSYPKFLDDFAAVGGKYEIVED